MTHKKRQFSMYLSSVTRWGSAHSLKVMEGEMGSMLDVGVRLGPIDQGGMLEPGE